MGARRLSMAAGFLALLSLGLPWVAPRTQRSSSGPSCIADLSGQGGLICDYIGVAEVSVVPGLPGTMSPARVLLVVALVLIAATLWPRATTPDGRLHATRLLAAIACLGAVGLGLPAVLSGQVTALSAGVLLLIAAGASPQWVRSRRSATWGETAGSNPRPSAR